ncbi:type II toxin-antitoxin system Phd/YefM family antitoxin [Sulfurovum sp. bin170]|uniref:type II toxin-antitoxin system Phd/YefM family antitoxin n=1 Tax=Sulfurovum sp. bin170 TaxID=2695268 RepID=UPI0013DE95E6|nr:type II toxin-antitoxin system Phd/YefM family antitoxin [Sulfurovum sp. bin170]NEW60198.1 type II toxin-antitoxin system Phd/YefM family antitoxin [Sulfurovum sp. bin170]
MQLILSNYTASISELKKSPTELLKKAGNEAIAILNHNTPSAYLVPSETYEKLMEMLDDYMLYREVKERLDNDSDYIEVSLNEL